MSQQRYIEQDGDDRRHYNIFERSGKYVTLMFDVDEDGNLTTRGQKTSDGTLGDAREIGQKWLESGEP